VTFLSRINFVNFKTIFYQDEKQNDQDETDYKTGQKFAQHMKDSNHASSDFAKRKTFTEQRRFLPAFAVRQEVCCYFKVIILVLYFFTKILFLFP